MHPLQRVQARYLHKSIANPFVYTGSFLANILLFGINLVIKYSYVMVSLFSFNLKVDYKQDISKNH
jgi:hypothetical protein